MFQCPEPRKCPPLAQERAQWRYRAEWWEWARGHAPARASANVNPGGSWRAALRARTSVRSTRFLPKKGEKVPKRCRFGTGLAVNRLFLGVYGTGNTDCAGQNSVG
jgi:hypothetical protein